jgi:acetoin:2,6-dichlorophenolindophenol oxidoreductase subunit alpha
MAAATGAALALRRTGGVAVAYFGDGATNHGYFHECLNFAAVNSLPVLFVCENNLYGEFTPWEDVTAGAILDRPRAIQIDARQVDGMDVFAVRAVAHDAVAQARAGRGPVFIEALTYRFVGHSRSDPAKYRKPGELPGCPTRWMRHGADAWTFLADVRAGLEQPMRLLIWITERTPWLPPPPSRP